MGVLDLVGFAVDMHQSAQIHNARQSLQRIEAGAMQEAARKQVLEVLRNFVFTIGQNLRALEQYTESLPQPAYIAAKTLLWNFQDAGITPEIFPEFTDKEYVQQVREKLHTIVQTSHNRLENMQLQQADLCVKFLIEMPTLEQAVGSHIARKQLLTTETEWRKLSNRRALYIICGVLALLFACPASILFFSIEAVILGTLAFLVLICVGGVLLTVSAS